MDPYREVSPEPFHIDPLNPASPPVLLPAAPAVDPHADAETSVATAVSTTPPVQSPGSKLTVAEGEDEDVPSGTDLSLEDMIAIVTPDYQASPESTLMSDRLSYPLDDLMCSVCKRVVNWVVETPRCHQLFCAKFICIWAWLDIALNLVSLHQQLSRIWSQVQVRCDFATSLEKLTCKHLVP